MWGAQPGALKPQFFALVFCVFLLIYFIFVLVSLGLIKYRVYGKSIECYASLYERTTLLRLKHIKLNTANKFWSISVPRSQSNTITRSGSIGQTNNTESAISISNVNSNYLTTPWPLKRLNNWKLTPATEFSWRISNLRYIRNMQPLSGTRILSCLGFWEIVTKTFVYHNTIRWCTFCIACPPSLAWRVYFARCSIFHRI